MTIQTRRSTVSRPRGRPPAPAAPRREQLLAASVKVFLKKGFHATRIEDIVAEAGTGKGTFYLVFEDKEAALGAAIDEFFHELEATLAWVNRSLAPGTTLEAIFEQEAARVFKTLTEHEDIGRLVLREGRSAGAGIERKIAGFYRQLLDMSTRNLAVAVALHLLPPQAARVSSICILGSIEKIYSLWLDGELKEKPETALRESLAFLLRGCGLPPDET